MSKSLQPHGLQHTRLPCPSPTSGTHSNLCLSSQWCHPTNSSSLSYWGSPGQTLPGHLTLKSLAQGSLHSQWAGGGCLGHFWSLGQCQFSCSIVSDSLRPHGLQHVRLPCPSPTPRACLSSCPSSQWGHPTISSSVVPFSSCLQSFPASGSFPVSLFFASSGQSIGVSASASVLPMNIQDWFPLGLTGWISLQSKGLSRVFSNTTVQKHQFFRVQLSL